MQNKKKALITAALLLFATASFFSITTAETLTSQITWITPQTTSIATAITATRCMNYPGNNNITVTVIDYPQNTYDTNATVTATIYKPNGDTNSNIPFTNNSDGNYTKTINFDTNGTFILAIHAVNDTNNNITADTNTYIYVGTFDINISFLSNNSSYSGGDSGSIRNMVKNTDGNAFTGLTGTTTIYYPNATVFAQDATMAETGNGEYYYNFIIPNTTGTYTATSAFTCGLSTDSNNAGRFTVTGTEIPPVTPAPVSPGGGGSGGGGPPIAEKPEEALKIMGSRFDENMELDIPTNVFVKVENTGNQKLDFLLNVEIKQGDSAKYSSSMAFYGLAPGAESEIVFEQKWIPVLSGSYRIVTEAVSLDKNTVFDRLVEKFVVGGGIWQYDILTACQKKIVEAGENADAKIFLLNLGNYYEDVLLEWWVEDRNSAAIGKSTFTFALYPDENREMMQSVFIPKETPAGKYIFKAKVSYGNLSQGSECSFEITRPAIIPGINLVETANIGIIILLLLFFAVLQLSLIIALSLLYYRPKKFFDKILSLHIHKKKEA